jgi:hypothetical protein
MVIIYTIISLFVDLFFFLLETLIFILGQYFVLVKIVSGQQSYIPLEMDFDQLSVLFCEPSKNNDYILAYAENGRQVHHLDSKFAAKRFYQFKKQKRYSVLNASGNASQNPTNQNTRSPFLGSHVSSIGKSKYTARVKLIF